MKCEGRQVSWCGLEMKVTVFRWVRELSRETPENLNTEEEKSKSMSWDPISDKSTIPKSLWQKTLKASSDNIRSGNNLSSIIFTISDGTVWHRSSGETRVIQPEDDELMGNGSRNWWPRPRTQLLTGKEHMKAKGGGKTATAGTVTLG